MRKLISVMLALSAAVTACSGLDAPHSKSSAEEGKEYGATVPAEDSVALCALEAMNYHGSRRGKFYKACREESSR